MKKIAVLLLLTISIFAHAQTVQSVCSAKDSVTKIWDKEAARLAMRKVYKSNLPYKDSLMPDPALRKRYRDALLAVYNATSIAATDTVFNQLSIRTNPSPELNNIRVLALPSLIWMTQLFNNQAPVGSTIINNLMLKYNMRYVYAQSTSYDVVVFTTDTCLNLPLLIPNYLSQGAISATNDAAYDDTRDITDSLNSAFVMLNYTFGWGTCGNGCDYKRTYSFKVYNDCSVEYLGASGVPLYTSVSELSQLQNKYTFVCPTSQTLRFVKAAPDGTVKIKSLDGRLLQTIHTTNAATSYDISALSDGIYCVEIFSNEGHWQTKLVLSKN